MKITDLDVKRAMRRLAAVHRPPDDKEAAVRVWRDVLGDLNASELISVVNEYLRSDARYFPKPGALRQMALRRRTGPANRSAGDGPDPAVECPACGAKIRLLDPDEQVLMRYDHGELRNYLTENQTGSQRYGIYHDLSVPHDGLPVVYGSERAQVKRGAA